MTSGDLDELVTAWLELASATTLRDVGMVPGRKWVGEGGGGIAIALWRLGEHDGAARWIRNLRRATPADRTRAQRSSPGSVMYGRTGVELAAALLGGDPRPLLDAAHRPPAKIDVVDGLAGLVLGALLLERTTHDARVVELVDRLAIELERRELPNNNTFAHGAAGVIYTRCQLARRRGQQPAAPLLARLDTIDRPTGELALSWCNGSAGIVLAWVFAYELTGDPKWLSRARAAAPELADVARPDPGTLCCGFAGRAYALLALARVDPRGPWHEQARGLVPYAFARDVPHHGMLRGLPGLVMLARDVGDPAAARFPLVDIAG